MCIDATSFVFYRPLQQMVQERGLGRLWSQATTEVWRSDLKTTRIFGFRHFAGWDFWQTLFHDDEWLQCPLEKVESEARATRPRLRQRKRK